MKGDLLVMPKNAQEAAGRQPLLLDVRGTELDRALITALGADFLRENCLLPLYVDGAGTLTLAVERANASLEARLSERGYERIRTLIAPRAEILRLLDEAERAGRQPEAVGREEKRFDDLPAVQLVESLLCAAIPARASDIHFEPQEERVRVRFRVDGDLYEHASYPIEMHPAVCARLKIRANLDIAEHRLPQDGRIDLAVGGKEYDLRVSTLPTVHGEKFVLRVLDKGAFSFTRDDLGFTARENALVDQMLARPHGVILLTGPTGCGKSTTLYAFLRELNAPTVNVVTVEDPVEYRMPGVNQIRVNNKTQLTFGVALRSILRQDPDILMIGEIRDEETAEIAVRAAITGHLVFSTLHTNDAPGAVMRLRNLGVPDYLLSEALIGVIAQRLVKRRCPYCGQITQDEHGRRFVAPGCRFCRGSGARGRVGIHEVMRVDDDLRALIADGAPVEAIRRAALQGGMTTLEDAYKRLVTAGEAK